MTALGQTRWAIAEGYIPGQSSFRIRRWSRMRPPAFLMPAIKGPMSASPYSFQIASRSDLIWSPSRRGARCICVSTISSGPNRFRTTRRTRRYSIPMYRSWCNTRGSIRDTLKSVCCRRPRMPRRRRARAPHRPTCAAIPVAKRQFPGLECTASQMRNKFPSYGLKDHLEVSP